MASQKQIDANRSNAQKSTGPRTDEGKARAKLNAITHGFRSSGLDVLPSEDPAAYQARVDTWLDHFRPTNPVEEQLVRHIADLSWKKDRITRFENVSLSRRVHEAIDLAREVRLDRYIDAESRLFPTAEEVAETGYDREPASSLMETIQESAEGCRRLIDRWKYLRGVLKGDPYWIPRFEMEAIRLLGGGAIRVVEEDVLDVVVANRVLMSGGNFIDPFCILVGPLGLIFDQTAARDACLRQPESVELAKASMMATADREIARLNILLEARERDGDLGAEEIAEAADLASFDPSGEGERLRRYQAAIQRDFVKSVETIAKLRLQQVKLDRERAKAEAEASNRANEPNSTDGNRESGIGSRAEEANCANEPNSSAGNRESGIGSRQKEANCANEPIFVPQIRANEPNLSRRERRRRDRQRRNVA